MSAVLEAREIDELVTRVDAALPGVTGRLVEFIASGRGEGTSTVARAYTAACASHLGRRVLLLTAGEGTSGPQGVLQLLATQQPIDLLLKPLPGGGHTAPLIGREGDEPARSLLIRTDLWQQLRSRFDELVLDMPSTAVSRIGLTVAGQCDGVVVVIEAEKTRAPVVENLVASLRALRANVLGTVLNKRRYYLPERVYRWL